MREVKVNEEGLNKCYVFAKEMIDKTHPDIVMKRGPDEIYLNTFMGKIGEEGVYQYFKKYFPSIECTAPDYIARGLGEWDTGDLIINGINVDVKSINEKSGFLLIETSRFQKNGNYSYDNSNGEEVDIDAYIVTKVYSQSITIQYKQALKDSNNKEAEKFFKGKECTVEILGGITRAEFWEKKHFISKGAKINFPNLNAACNNKPITMETEYSRLKKKNFTVQTDNYVLRAITDKYPPYYPNELKDIFDILNIK